MAEYWKRNQRDTSTPYLHEIFRYGEKCVLNCTSHVTQDFKYVAAYWSSIIIGHLKNKVSVLHTVECINMSPLLFVKKVTQIGV